MSSQKIVTNLWFDSQAEEAAKFYTSLFKNSKIGKISHYTAEGKEHHGKPEGSVLAVEYTLDGQNYVAINGGPIFQFTPAISLAITCEDQKEIDHFWYGLLEGGGKESMCGWLTDRYGLSWQVSPRILSELMADPDREKARRVTAAMFEMKKFDIAILKAAANG